MSQTRRYRKRKRAVQEEDTRRRITEAVVDLHRTVGPANTTVTEVAERAGVSRMTVYNHFPTDADLIEACSTHWASQHPFPNPETWSSERTPRKRLHHALVALYGWYRETQDMAANVLRDSPIVPALADVMQTHWWTYIDTIVETLSAGWPDSIPAKELEASLRIVVDFRTWQLLANSGLDDDRAARMAGRIVACASGRNR